MKDSAISKTFSATALMLRGFVYKELIDLIMYSCLERVRFLNDSSNYSNFKHFWNFSFIQA